jgi:hydrogenase nickel incorporation protein HypA/HybF
MHEASVTQSLVGIALEEAERSGAKRVVSIDLTIGEATGYSRDSIEFFFGLFSKGTLLEGAVLNLTYVKPKFHCAFCGNGFERRGGSFDCPACGSRGEMTGGGTEFYIDAIDIESEDP